MKAKGSFISKLASRVSTAITTVNVVSEIFGNSAAINQITDHMYSREMTSITREGLIAKYIIYSELVNILVKNGSVTYKTKLGNVTDIKIDWNKVNKTKLDLGFEDDLVQKLFK
jgi:hypothetical protein